MPQVILREREAADLPILHRWLHAERNAAWRAWDGPYFHVEDARPPLDLSTFVEQLRTRAPSPHARIIAVDGVCAGQVTRWSEPPASGGWWELGIVLYDPVCWGGGLGTRALRAWTALTFQETHAHVLTLSTWSGNERMVRAAERVGFRECGRVREARWWQGRRYDSVKLDLLRRSWDADPALSMS
ncbi:GNAT family N-acetyltransferase [Deinococcus maricopensis]|uniref:GCN5-related N-acetyltransferase n=1 Tax=Deinococcus maricopensis (strain DSM 21211 / LMG 22137 / NRRL B-23946 / LB-34) TaxID=709986 RepID=E8UAV8_DEIML|nr:GNAT family protein [Deinococcus maricopensis]ADV68197.1 GCN5-related N-acetyltransferase [Deinococcus maricopensis DSM 21211]